MHLFRTQTARKTAVRSSSYSMITSAQPLIPLLLTLTDRGMHLELEVMALPSVQLKLQAPPCIVSSASPDTLWKSSTLHHHMNAWDTHPLQLS